MRTPNISDKTLIQYTLGAIFYLFGIE